MGGVRRVVAVAVAGLALTCGLGTTDAASKTWKLTALDGPKGTEWRGTVANDVSDSGYVGGAWVGENERFHAAYWYQGKAHDLTGEIGIPAGTTYSYVYSVNSGGLMGGRAADESGYTAHAVLWDVKKGTLLDLHPSGADVYASEVAGVNASGDAAGDLVVADDVWGYRYVPYVWPQDDRAGFQLPGADDYVYAWVSAINSSGTMVGTGITADTFQYHALVWEKQAGGYVVIDLQDAIGDAGGDLPETQALDVGEDGAVVGLRYPPYTPGDFRTFAFSWTASDGLAALDDGGAGHSIAWKAVSKYVCGGIGFGRVTPYGGYVRNDATLWVNGVLEVVATSFMGRPYVETASVNKNGLAVGTSFVDDDDYPISWYAEWK